MELADVLDSKSSGRDTVSVRPRSPAPKKQDAFMRPVFLSPSIDSVEQSPAAGGIRYGNAVSLVKDRRASGREGFQNAKRLADPDHNLYHTFD